jgi:tetratricopeptide (TPR) repeat protein
MLARAYTRLSRLDEARAQLRHALELYQRVGDRNGLANTHLNASLVWERQGNHRQALDHARTALDLFVAQGDRAGQVRARNAVGWYHALLGDHAQALSYCQAALADEEALTDRRFRAPIWDSLGYAHHKLGHHTQAVACFRRFIHLAEAQQAGGDIRQARATWRQALDILTELDPPAAEQVRIAMASLPAKREDSQPEASPDPEGLTRLGVN